MGDKPLLNFAFADTSGNRFPMANASFVYGTLGNTGSVDISGNKWGSLAVSIPDNVFSNNKNNNLVSVSTDNYGLTFNVGGIYQITTTLQFTISAGLSTSSQSFAFSYSKNLNNNTTTTNILSATENNISGHINFLEGNTSLDAFNYSYDPLFINGSSSGGGINNTYSSNNYGGNVTVLPKKIPTLIRVIVNGVSTPYYETYYPPFFILPNIMSSSTNKNVNIINSIYYIPAETTIYFNIANTTSPNINATGNFTVRLLNSIYIQRGVRVTPAVGRLQAF
jgi:hypothetical protein